MKWTRERPTIPGAYWLKHDKRFSGKPNIVNIVVSIWDDTGKRLDVEYFGSDEYDRLDNVDGEWLGPIEPKEE